MTKKKPKITPRHFRGITTVEDLKARCLVDDFTGCWHWRGATSLDKHGRKLQRLWIYDSVQGRFRTFSGPLAVLELEGTRTAETEMGWRAGCNCDDCMNPAHIMGGTRKEWGRWVRHHGAWRGLPTKVAAQRRAVRGRATTMLDQQKANEIRVRAEAGEDKKALAAEYGLKNWRYIHQIASGVRWANPVVPGASVFTLGAL